MFLHSAKGVMTACIRAENWLKKMAVPRQRTRHCTPIFLSGKKPLFLHQQQWLVWGFHFFCTRRCLPNCLAWLVLLRWLQTVRKFTTRCGKSLPQPLTNLLDGMIARKQEREANGEWSTWDRMLGRHMREENVSQRPLIDEAADEVLTDQEQSMQGMN